MKWETAWKAMRLKEASKKDLKLYYRADFTGLKSVGSLRPLPPRW